MKNLNEPRKKEPDVIPFERRNTIQLEKIEEPELLLPVPHVEELRGCWTAIQSSFVDGPRKAVEEADKLVLLAIKQIEEVLSAERVNLEKQWSDGEQASTEDLRVCLQRYRDFFDRLLSRM